MGEGPSRVAELHINKSDETVGIYAIAYLDAAIHIFEHGVCDFAPYPAMFCLRHGLELFVKQISVYRAYELRDKTLLYQTGHGLLKGWSDVKEHVVETCCSGYTGFSDDVSAEQIDELDTLIEELHRVDPKGTLFRYPEEFSKGKGRVDTHFPDDAVNLNDWRATAEYTLNTCQAIEFCLGTRCGLIGPSPRRHAQSLYDIVMDMPDERNSGR
jgi:hypothetical protein